MHDPIATHLDGRKLTLNECPDFTEEQLTNHPHVTSTPAVTDQGCQRCGNADPTLFGLTTLRNSDQATIYCRKCIQMGRMTSTEKLFTWKGPSPVTEPSNHTLSWNGTLSNAQQPASTKIVNTMQQNDSLLVWAVCGAGKTELLFEAIYQALQQGKRVCLTTPRTDVILELAPRLKEVFPNTPIAVLYGGTEDRDMWAPLVLATTHQLLRYHQAFDFMIVDEVDAFPYTMDESLQRAVENARKQPSAIAWLSATPSAKWKRECQMGTRNHVLIPARYHGHPIPVPTFTWIGRWQNTFQKGKIPRPLIQWIEKRINAKAPMLLFFPSIATLEQALPLIQKYFPIPIQGVHSQDPTRKEKVADLRTNDTQLLLTTTILERGVTIPRVDVAVIGAESPIFTEAALVQIAGRVGRKAEHPTGECRLFHFGKSFSMVQAKRHIEKMNALAKERGLLK